MIVCFASFILAALLCAPCCCSPHPSLGTHPRHTHMHDTLTTVCVEAFLCELVHAHWSHSVHLFVSCIFTFLKNCCFLLVFFLIALCLFFLLIHCCGAVCLCACSAIAPIPTAPCCAADAAVCYFGCAWLCDLSLVLFSLCVDVLLVCAEGYTQVTGVMALMMTGRVLLVCALCVLWCGTPGVDATNHENNAVGVCMTSGGFGGKMSYLSSGCDKTDVGLAMRSILPITAAEASDDEVVSNTADINSQSSQNSNADTAGGGGSGGSGGIVNNFGDDREGVRGHSDSRSHDDLSSSSILNEVVDSNALSGPIPAKSRKSPEKDPKSEEMSTRPLLPELVVQEDTITKAHDQLSHTIEKAGNQVVGGGAAGEGVKQRDMGTTGPSSNQPAPPAPQEITQTPADPPGKGGLPAPTESRNKKDQPLENLPLTTKTESEALETSLGDQLPERKRHEEAPADLMKDAVTDNPGKTTATSISTIDSGDAHEKEGKDDDTDERPTSKEHNSSPETGNTNDAPTASEAEPQRAETTATTVAKKNDTTPGERESSNAVSHTTSPLLLLLLVACAAAAAVVAA
ncbi:Mucin-associated surface protein (MASP) [Trypanosoma cruzi]|nr:Mucin-associated surface protein (MASP) [Trypanosoma cruzi]